MSCPDCDDNNYLKNKEPCLKCIHPHYLFHHLWSKAVGTEGYNKKQWLRLEKFVPLKKIRDA